MSEGGVGLASRRLVAAIRDTMLLIGLALATAAEEPYWMGFAAVLLVTSAIWRAGEALEGVQDAHNRPLTDAGCGMVHGLGRGHERGGR